MTEMFGEAWPPMSDPDLAADDDDDDDFIYSFSLFSVPAWVGLYRMVG